MAELSEPFPPGDYPVVVIGSGPGALQIAYSLGRLGVEHAVISADPAPGGMFRRWPFFQRLLSWTKPHAPAERGSRAYERYDWNSLLGDEPDTRAIQPEPDGRLVLLPVAPGDGGQPRRIRGPRRRRRSATAVRWTATARVDDAGRRPVRGRDDGRRRIAARSWSSRSGSPSRTRHPGSGWNSRHHYADVRPVEDVRGPAGAHHRQAELGLRARQRAAAMGAPAGHRLALEGPPVGRHQVAGRRSGRATSSRTRTSCWAAGSASWMPRSTASSGRRDGRLTAYLRRTDGGADLDRRGRRRHLGDRLRRAR